MTVQEPRAPRPDASSSDQGWGGAGEDQREEELRQRYRELLEELRTVLPGVQVLFAFLLVAPFSSRFSDMDRLGRLAFTSALMAVALASLLLFAPAAYHRVGERRDRERRLRVSIRLQVSGLVVLSLAISDAVFVVTRFLYSTVTGVVLGGAVLVIAVVLWFALPARQRGRFPEDRV